MSELELDNALAESEQRYSRKELESILANRWPSVFCEEGSPGTPNQFAKNLVAFFGSHPRGLRDDYGDAE